jgi:hypothetical protein
LSLFLITPNTAEKGVAFTFPSGRAFSMNSSGTKESFNPDFQFQEYDDLDNKVGMTDVNFLISILRGICEPARIIALVAGLIGFILLGFYFCDTFTRCNRFLYFMSYSVPFLLIAPAYLYENLNLEIISILFAVYYYGCSLLFDFRIIVP